MPESRRSPARGPPPLRHLPRDSLFGGRRHLPLVRARLPQSVHRSLAAARATLPSVRSCCWASGCWQFRLVPAERRGQSECSEAHQSEGGGGSARRDCTRERQQPGAGDAGAPGGGGGGGPRGVSSAPSARGAAARRQPPSHHPRRALALRSAGCWAIRGAARRAAAAQRDAAGAGAAAGGRAADAKDGEAEQEVTSNHLSVWRKSVRPKQR